MRFSHRQGCLVVALAALACALPATAGASSRAVTRDTSFCGVAKSFALSLRAAPTTQSLAAAQSQLKTNITSLVSARGSLVAAAPSSIRKRLGTVIGLYSQLKADLAKNGWSLTALATHPAMMAGLLADARKDAPSFNKLGQYLTKTCHY